MSRSLDEFGFDESFLSETLDTPEVLAAIRAGSGEARVRDLGKRVIEAGGANTSWLPEELGRMTRDSVRQFATTEVEPIAQQIHEKDLLVPDSLISKMSELGYFAMSIPEEYGGGGMETWR